MSAAHLESEGLQGQGQGEETSLRVAGLRELGAHRFDPPRFRYLEALCRRAASRRGAARRALETRLNLAVAHYQVQFETLGTKAKLPLASSASSPHRGPLGELVAYIDIRSRAEQDPLSGDATAPASSGAALADLKTLRQFRNTWTSLRIDQQMSRSQAQIPDNPGPLNSHLLVLRSLELMQEISPVYLKHFMSHVESLFWLDQASFGGLPAQSKTMLRQTDNKKRKPGNVKSALQRR